MGNCTPISSSCVLWQGPLINCISNCRNESIEDVIFRLSEIVCSLVNQQTSDCNCANAVMTQNFECYNTDQSINTGIPTYTLTTEELLEVLFTNFVCTKGETVITYQTIRDKIFESNQPLALPTCLQYVEKGQTITELLYRDYILLLAEHICALYDLIETQNVTISSIQDDITIIQAWIDAHVDPAPITITSSCASAPTVGETVEISAAFEAFETHYCNYISVLGSTTDWNNAVGMMCVDLNTEPQMQDLDAIMMSLPNWIETPSNVAENYNNLWLTICDLRTGLQGILESQAILPCITAPAENLTIDSYDVTNADISWTASSLVGIQNPLSYLIEIYEWNGISIGSLVYSNVYAYPLTTANIVSASINALQEYAIKIYAVYSCGQSAAIMTTGVLKDVTIFYQINVSEVSDRGITTPCDEGGGPIDYNYITTTTTLNLVNAISGLPDTYTSPIIVILQYTTSHPDFGTFTQNVPITIPTGDSTVDYEYVSEQTILSTLGTCEKVTKTLTCGVMINNVYTEFGTGITEC